MAVVGLVVAGLVVQLRNATSEPDTSGDGITTDSADDASEPVVDEDYRFRLEAHNPDWKLLHPADLGHFAPDALAGAMDTSSGSILLIIALQSPGADTEASLRSMLETLQAQNVVLGQASPSKVGDYAAVEMTAEAEVGGNKMHYLARSFQRDDHVFTLLGSTTKLAERTHLREAFLGFKPLPGKVTPRAIQTKRADRQGHGWQIRQGVFQSAAFGLRVKPPEGWYAVGGSDAHVLHGDAEVALISDNPMLSLAIVPRIGGPRDIHEIKATFFDDLAPRLGAEVTKETHTATLAGKTIELRRLQIDHQPPQEYLAGYVQAGDRYLEVMFWYAPAMRSAIEPRLQPALDAVAVLDDDERAKLQAEIGDKAATGDDLIGPESAYRGAVYHHYGKGLSWHHPRTGLWRVWGDTNARGRQFITNDPLAFAVPSEGLSGSFGWSDAVTAEEHHNVIVAAVLGNAENATSKPSPPSWGATTPQVSVANAFNNGIQYEYWIATAIHAGQAYHFSLHFPLAKRKTAEPLATQALANFALGRPLKNALRQGDEHIDQRMGFALRGPAGWTLNAQPVVQGNQLASMAHWVDGQNELMALAMYLPDTSDSWREGFVEQLMRKSFGKLTGSRPKRDRTRLAGQDARRMIFSDLLRPTHVYVFSRGGIAYAVVVRARSSKIKDLTKNLRLLALQP